MEKNDAGDSNSRYPNVLTIFKCSFFICKSRNPSFYFYIDFTLDPEPANLIFLSTFEFVWCSSHPIRMRNLRKNWNQ